LVGVGWGDMKAALQSGGTGGDGVRPRREATPAAASSAGATAAADPAPQLLAVRPSGEWPAGATLAMAARCRDKGIGGGVGGGTERGRRQRKERRRG